MLRICLYTANSNFFLSILHELSSRSSLLCLFLRNYKMPFSHHSHSGQFCGHATDTLEEVVQRAIALKMQVFALTEHMPRDQDSDLYPEEVAPQPLPSAPTLTPRGR